MANIIKKINNINFINSYELWSSINGIKIDFKLKEILKRV
jgi:hypothetical protein